MKITNNFYKTALITVSVLLIAVSVSFAVYLYSNKTSQTPIKPETGNVPIKQTTAIENVPDQQPSTTAQTIQKRFNNTILLSQVKYTQTNGYLEVYAIDPEAISSALVYKINIPQRQAAFSSGSYNAYGANDSIQWSNDGNAAVFKIEKYPGPGSDLPYFTAFYKFDPEKNTSELIYKSENIASASWLLDKSGKTVYLVEGDQKIEKADGNTHYFLMHLNVNDKTTEQSVPIDNPNHDGFVWNRDNSKFLWAGKENQQYILYSYDPKAKTITQDNIQAIETTYGPVSYNISNNNDKFITSGFFGQSLYVYDFNKKSAQTIDIGKPIGNYKILWGENDQYVLVNTRKENPDDKSQPFTQLWGFDLTDKSQTMLFTSEGKEYGGGPFPYKLTKYGFLIENERNKLYLYRDRKLNLIPGISLSRSTMGISDF